MSNIFLTLDYELFFGSRAGSVENCMLKPTNKLLAVLDKHHIKATFFVDSGYLLRAKAEQAKSLELVNEYNNVVQQLKKLDAEGHSIQLHIHPHWEDSYHDGRQWIMDTRRYKLHDFTENEIDDIVSKYKKTLTDIVTHKVFAHRAGGWCIQPFFKLHKAFTKHNIWLDSTVFENGKNDSKTHFFNFKNSPKKTAWSFENDPLIEEEEGFFKELPISAYRLSPWFFWRLIFFKKFAAKEQHNFGDGRAAGGSTLDKLRMLVKPTNSVVSIDGYKSSFLERAFQAFQKKDDNRNFVIIGHPKSMSEYSLEKLENFIIKNNSNNFKTIRDFKHEL